jgi:hypothetical protein
VKDASAAIAADTAAQNFMNSRREIPFAFRASMTSCLPLPIEHFIRHLHSYQTAADQSAKEKLAFHPTVQVFMESALHEWYFLLNEHKYSTQSMESAIFFQ